MSESLRDDDLCCLCGKIVGAGALDDLCDCPTPAPQGEYVKCPLCGEAVKRHSLHDCRATRNFTSSDWSLLE